MERDAWNGPADRIELRVPTMISDAEARYLHWLGREHWTGRGAVVEVGPWLGGSTYCLAAGMRASGRPAGKRLVTYDTFLWREFMAERADLPLEPGASFEPWFRANIAPFAEVVVARRMALPDEPVPGDSGARDVRYAGDAGLPLFRYDDDAPVEILFVDGAKSWRGMRHLLRELAPRLVPGETTLVCQDYKYWGTYWVPLMMERLGDRVAPIHDVDPGSTVAFRLRAPIGAEWVDGLPDGVQGLDLDRALAALDAAAWKLEAAGDGQGALQVRLARVPLLAHRGEVDRAVAELRRAQRAWPVTIPTAQLERARRFLAKDHGARVRRPLGHRLGGWIGPALVRLGEWRKRLDVGDVGDAG